MPPDATLCCLCSPLVLSGAMLETDGQATEGGKHLNITTVESHRADDTQRPQPQAQSWRDKCVRLQSSLFLSDILKLFK